MSRMEKLIKKLLSGNSDSNFDFNDLKILKLNFGFTEDVRESHHTFRLKNHEAFINIQPLKGNKAKPYQVKQVT